MEAGEKYTVDLDVYAEKTGTKLRVYVGAGNFQNITPTLVKSHYTVTLLRGNSDQVRFYTTGGYLIHIDNVVVRKTANVIILSDSCQIPVDSQNPHIEATYNTDTDTMELNVDGVITTCPYDGSLGAGVLGTECSISSLERANT
jgi:hypothetical protein